MEIQKNTENNNNNEDNFKILLSELKELKKELTESKNELNELKKTLTNHIGFVDNVFSKIQRPFFFIFNKIENMFRLEDKH